MKYGTFFVKLFYSIDYICHVLMHLCMHVYTYIVFRMLVPDTLLYILLYMFILLFIIGNNLLMTRSVHWWVGRRPDCHNFLKGGKFHFHAPNGALVFKELIPFPVFYLLSLFYHSIIVYV